MRHKEGLMHGFLALRTLEGKKLADGEMTQVAEGDRLTDDLIFRFNVRDKDSLREVGRGQQTRKIVLMEDFMRKLKVDRALH